MFKLSYPILRCIATLNVKVIDTCRRLRKLNTTIYQSLPLIKLPLFGSMIHWIQNHFLVQLNAEKKAVLYNAVNQKIVRFMLKNVTHPNIQIW